MDLVLQTSLEALLLKATNSQDDNIDAAAVETFCVLINKEREGPFLGAKALSARLPSGSEREILQTLTILDICMSRCGGAFQSEVGKFRFLNEMIKLVSPKYLGTHTAFSVKQKVLQLLYSWTYEYPKETKIKEAFDMLRKQGVVREIPTSLVASSTNSITQNDASQNRKGNSVFQDEEKSRILQKLLQSKDPEDIQAANWLIKSMVREEDRKRSEQSKRDFELEAAQNKIRLLSEMLDSYNTRATTRDEIDLINELHESCQRLQPKLEQMCKNSSADDCKSTQEVEAELQNVFAKYSVVINGKKLSENGTCKNDYDCLLNFGHDAVEKTESDGSRESNVDVLCDLFSNSVEIPEGDILKPISVLQKETKIDENKLSAFEELDIIGKNLLKENLNPQQSKENIELRQTNKILESTLSLESNHKDDYLLDITENVIKEEVKPEARNNLNDEVPKVSIKLSDIETIKLEDIIPSDLPPKILLDEKNGLSVTLHFGKNKPKKDVQVFVITTISKNKLPLSNYLFQAVVPKCCKVRLQPPSATNLPAYNPFLPPSALTQIMLIGNPDNVQISLKFVISYTIDDETITEMGGIDNLPFNDQLLL